MKKNKTLEIEDAHKIYMLDMMTLHLISDQRETMPPKLRQVNLKATTKDTLKISQENKKK